MANKNSILEPLIKENERLRQENKQLQDSVETLNKRINTLEEKLATLKKNSRNSSKPPSSHIVKPPKPQAKEGKRKQGAQPGHPKRERLKEIRAYREENSPPNEERVLTAEYLLQEAMEYVDGSVKTPVIQRSLNSFSGNKLSQ